MSLGLSSLVMLGRDGHSEQLHTRVGEDALVATLEHM